MSVLRKLQPEWLLFAVATWHAALGITAVTALAHGWDREYAEFMADHLMWAGALAYIGWVLRENRRLRITPAWQAASDAWTKGYAAGVRATKRATP